MTRLLAALLLAALLTGCGPSADAPTGWRPTPMETALIASRSALDAAATWYGDACVLRLPGIAASEELCLDYRAKIGPATHAAHNAAVGVAIGVRDGGAALAAVHEAIQIVVTASNVDANPERTQRLYVPLVVALTLIERRLAEVTQ